MLLKRLVATEHSLVDFLMNEVIELQTPTMQDFLIETAELDTFDAALCDAALERSDSAELLDGIRSANLFLIGLDDGWFRYHHLFGEFLRACLRRVDPRRPATIHRSAAAAFAARGDVIAAIRHSMAAGDIATAVHHLTLHMATSTTLDDQSVGGAVARAWLDRHGLAELATAPQTVLACVIALNGANLSDEAAVWLERVGANEAALDDASRCMLHQTRCFHLLYQGDPESALECAERAQAIVDEHGIDSVWVAAMPTQVLQAQLWLGDAVAARATIDQHRPGANHSQVVSTVRMPGYASQLEVLRGDFVAAQRFAEQSKRAAAAISLPVDAFGMAEPVATLAEVALEQGRLGDAEAHIEHLMRIVDNGRRPLLELKGHLLFAQLAAASGDDVVVDLHLDRARHIRPNAASAVVAYLDRADLLQLLRRRELPAAAALLRRLPPCLETDLLTARLLVRSGDHTGAAAALASPSELGTPRLQIEHGVLSALATAPADLDSALARLDDALGLASAMGYHRTIVDEGPELWALLRSLPDDRGPTDYVGNLLAAADGALLASRRTIRNDLVEPLSEREITVLRYLTSRLDGTQIAAALYVSINTVRSHFKAIYRKLGVNSRQEAVERARALGLI
jgi:LuxR family maltose regulon positive regulatory protein